ncbi:aminotransferase class III-fold pyridoxal phosphate-dependent enzyme [Leucobacter sp. wl10]|uniref:aminotransferase class III-fold pyridoxal phosphate-dependent enzyme n=1 Tax=Leucobacter sp. wl10 TaxID=2304677 RepID=UPI000E5B01AE|nr:aminotransferase class III-fold pyridoxal phosphate-dependent enzyme [Leucobacter sp. wl10]RGE22016.1 aminotransferase class III-fold pyridoxal phosphate-dependent enzyme [Leucobacter sp. wl10]
MRDPRIPRDRTREQGAAPIVDEVQAGCGRTGEFYALEPSGIVPDVVATAKSIGGFGLPMALNLIAPELDAWEPGEHTGAFRGDQLAFVAAGIALAYRRETSFRELVKRCGPNGGVIKLMPPINTPTAQLVEGLRLTGEAIPR